MTLPTWLKDASGKWYCEDLTELGFAQRCQFIPIEDAFFRFDLPAFDQWLSRQPEGEAKTHLLAVRAKAKAARNLGVKIAYLTELKTNLNVIPRLRSAQRKGSRSQRRPRLAEWLDKQLRLRTEASAKELWRALPEQSAGEDLYRTGEDEVTELRQDYEPMAPLTFEGFKGQVTAAKKRAKAAINRG